MLQIRLGLLALLLPAAPAACAPTALPTSSAPAAQSAPAAPAEPARPAAADSAGALGLRPGDLVIVDADAGEAADTERRGVLFLAAAGGADGASWGRPEILAADERWLEPVDVLLLPDRTLLVLEQ